MIHTLHTHPSSHLVVGASYQCAPVIHQDQGNRASLGESFCTPGSFEPQKIVGTKSCPMAFMPTGLMVLHRNGPDPLWFKTWAYQSVLTVYKTFYKRLNDLPIRSGGLMPTPCPVQSLNLNLHANNLSESKGT